MCGIYSILNYQETDDHGIYHRSFVTMSHRGPDKSIYSIIDPKVIFGFHRLRINGLNSEADQPLVDGDIQLICNGEIFNMKSLIRDFDLKMKTDSDCEVILHLFIKVGMKRTIELLDGEFAFCLYDPRHQEFYIARDHIGIRPLFVGTNNSNNVIGFSSEAKGLTDAFDNVQQYSPGCYSVYNLNNNTSEKFRWYDFNTMDLVSNNLLCQKYKTYSREQILTEVRKRLIESVNDRTDLSDRPVGCFLSGGLDSSLVTAIMSQGNKNIHCFSVGLEGSLDILAAEKVAKHLNLKNHHVVKFTVEEGIKAIPHVIRSLETYDITTIRASTPQWLLSKYVKENTDVTVLLSGEVPDEIIPGYWAFAFCKTDKDFVELSKNMMEELHEYDLLRTDRTTANFGLEVRVPFAQRELLTLFNNVDVKFRRFDEKTIEKSLLRDAFKEDNLLPEGILYRKKHAFSDGIDGGGICFYKEVEKYANTIINKMEWDQRFDLYPNNTPVSKESFYYRKIFETMYPGRHNLIRGFWMPKIKDDDGNLIKDPSATALPGHKIDTDF